MLFDRNSTVETIQRVGNRKQIEAIQRYTGSRAALKRKAGIALKSDTKQEAR